MSGERRIGQLIGCSKACTKVDRHGDSKIIKQDRVT